jgi:hypothetical protein
VIAIAVHELRAAVEPANVIFHRNDAMRFIVAIDRHLMAVTVMDGGRVAERSSYPRDDGVAPMRDGPGLALPATPDRQTAAAFRTVECRVAAEHHGHGVEVARVHEAKVATLELLDLLDGQQCCQTVHLNLRPERF